MWLLAASDASWSVPVEMALDRRARLHGLAPATTDRGLVLRTRSVHGFGMRTPLAVLVLDAAGTVIDRALLRPWTVVVAPAATWITEIPATVVPPPAGTELVLLRRILRG